MFTDSRRTKYGTGTISTKNFLLQQQAAEEMWPAMKETYKKTNT